MVPDAVHTTGFIQALDEKRQAKALGEWADVWKGMERAEDRPRERSSPRPTERDKSRDAIGI